MDCRAVGSGMAASGLFGATALAAGHSAVVVGGECCITASSGIAVRECMRECCEGVHEGVL